MSEARVEDGTLDSSMILKRHEAWKACQGQSEISTVSRLLSLLIGEAEIGFTGGNGMIGGAKDSSGLQSGTEDKRRTERGCRCPEGSRAVEGKLHRSRRLARAACCCQRSRLPSGSNKQQETKKQRHMNAQIVSVIFPIIIISLSLSTTGNVTTCSHLTKHDRRGPVFWILEMRPCPVLGPHAGDGWTCTNVRLAESNGFGKNVRLSWPPCPG